MTDAATFEDAFNMLCGKKLGEGIHRTVYECKINPVYVVKVENDVMRYFANVRESLFWSDNEHYRKVADWLAPCSNLSPDGRLLLQYRVDPVPLGFQMPEKVPAFITDTKRENFGMFEGRLVCVDYATTIGNPSLALKKAYW